MNLWKLCALGARCRLLHLEEEFLHDNFFVAVLVLVLDDSRVRLGFTSPNHEYQSLLLKAHPALVQGFRLCLCH